MTPEFRQVVALEEISDELHELNRNIGSIAAQLQVFAARRSKSDGQVPRDCSHFEGSGVFPLSSLLSLTDPSQEDGDSDMQCARDSFAGHQ